MGEFYIEDYIWLIAIGVFVLFVIIGFVADKTGLARKTFGKTPADTKKSDTSKRKEVVQEVPAFETDEMVLPVIDSIEGDMEIGTNEIQVDEPATDFLESETDNLYLSNEDVSNVEDNETESENLYLNEEVLQDSTNNLYLSEEVSQDSSNDLYLNEEVAQDDVLNDIETSFENNSLEDENAIVAEEDLYQPLGDVTFDNSVDTSENTDEEDVWQLEDKEEKAEMEDDLVLPNLDDLNAETDEDVWKF